MRISDWSSDVCSSDLTDGFQQKGGIKFDIGFQHTIRFSAMQSIERNAFYTLRKAEPGANTVERPERSFERIGAGVTGAVDTMAETHQSFAVIKRANDPALAVAVRLDQLGRANV